MVNGYLLYAGFISCVVAYNVWDGTPWLAALVAMWAIMLKLDE